MAEDPIERATGPARWLLGLAVDGVALTQTHVLARAVVREGVERWPGWWNSEVHGPPHREAEVRVLEVLREGLTRLRLVRRRGRKLVATARGRELCGDPPRLLGALAEDLAGEADTLDALVADAIIDALLGAEARAHEDLERAVAAAGRAGGWADAEGRLPTADDVIWDVGHILCRGVAYGLIEHRPEPEGAPWSTLIALSDAGREHFGSAVAELRALAPTPRAPTVRLTDGAVLCFDLELADVPDVGARVAVGAGQHLSALHNAIQEAFGWLDDRLYSFWLDGRFWSDPAVEYTSPINNDGRAATADVPIAELGIEPGAPIAYLFDFGDEWRVMLRLSGQEQADGRDYPRVLERSGAAPPQY